jgi:ABC-type polysaccharide/polyol phosphate transport system ATPase subunit
MNAIEATNLGIKFRIAFKSVSARKFARRLRNDEPSSTGSRDPSGEFWAFRNISFALKKGGSLGIIGKNGSGKSTLLRVIAGIYLPDEGECTVRGHAGLLQPGVGFHQELSGQDNIYISAAILGFTKQEIDRIYPDIVEFSELGQFIDAPIKTYSSGMVARLGFAISINLRPDILLFDEVFAVGDESFREKCRSRIHELREDGRTILFVSHNMREIRALCERTIVLEKGRVIFDGPSEEAADFYLKRIAEKKKARGVLRDLG